MSFGVRFGALVAVIVGAFVIYASLERPGATSAVQEGYRGTGQDVIYHNTALAAAAAANQLPEEQPPVDAAGQKASEVYKNVQVLKDVDISEFNRLMASMTAWVAPQQGCAYCHAEGQDFSDDSLYTKKVARRMLQMTRHINADWKSHVAATGVTCYTCHRGQPVPSYVWFKNNGNEAAQGPMGGHTGKNQPSYAAGLAALPVDPFTPFLENKADGENIRVISTEALPSGDRRSIKQAEWTYALMIHMSESLGVNCTYCHNSRAFSSWDQSSPARANAWYGIRMVRDLNETYLQSLQGTFPPNRLGVAGDVPKINCLTCHQGVFKPLLGASMVKTYPELETTQVSANAPPAQPAAPPAAPEPTAPAAPAAPAAK
ncbi:photosynthetic reaction center cytochrome PufC [Beijerinckia sp. L45]|uniref:photosynthetic reaction center cytochrome PufC n=1 Tax=Beijerinckia sp. L45 TaxID=1641855 RepID=UPI00131C2BEA|nr:photosynthetic reaction center cytochrome PufC [Beijerinckia sp. L45]